MNWKKIIHRHAFLSLLFPILFFFLKTTVEFSRLRVNADTAFELTPQFFKLVTAGYWPAAVELLWIKTLQGADSGVELPVTKISFSKFYELAQSLDPYFYETYEQGAIFFAFMCEDSDESLRILDRGIRVYETGLAPQKFWTQAHMLYIFRAYVHGFLKFDFISAKRDYLRASELPRAPQYLTQMKSWLKEEGSEQKLAVRVLKTLVKTTSDPQIKKKYQEKLNLYER